MSEHPPYCCVMNGYALLEALSGRFEMAIHKIGKL
jgi:hypothetical protein